ncbi:unnamed protein product, partial [Musa hybrid cultivar]
IAASTSASPPPFSTREVPLHCHICRFLTMGSSGPSATFSCRVAIWDRRSVDLVDASQLRRGQPHQPFAVGADGAAGGGIKVGLEAGGAEGVDEANEHGGTAAAGPEHGVLEGVTPGRT